MIKFKKKRCAMRLDKYLSLNQVGTRKKVKEYIYGGMVTVNHVVICEPSFDLDEETCHVTYNDVPLSGIATVYYMFHKPKGCITIKSHPNKPTVFDYFKDVPTTGLFAVGRLDKDTEGLLLLTNDGDMNDQLMFPDHHVEKRYYFIARGTISLKEKESLELGILLESGQETKPAKLEIVKNGCYYDLEQELIANDCQINGKDLSKEDVVCGYLTISQGMKHQVRNMLKHIHCTVIYLKRVAIGNLYLTEHLEKGTHLSLSKEELLGSVFGENNP